MSESFGQGEGFVDRRSYGSSNPAGMERRQFSSSYHDLSEDARELGIAIDKYKLENRRKFITYEEMLNVVKSLGYAKEPAALEV